MATKLEKLVTCHVGLLPIMLLYPLFTWSCKIAWETKIISPLPQHLWSQTLAGYGSPWMLSTHKVTWPYNHVVLWGHVTNWNISTTSLPMATKLGRMRTSLEWLLPIKSHDHIIKWSSKVTWQTEIIMYP